ncbi:T9SS type A sorting domain-containing protein [Chryseobacterium indoltheticum]|uniref:T9SS type A sorting domain-containing protein n=1 Tax=Chryseobacterium indoltheticum TaxID=254 RepID=UPI003F49AFEA
MVTNQISESTYNTGNSNYIDFKQCNNNLFVHVSDASMYSSKLFLVNNQISQQIALPDGAITSSTCIDDRLLYVSRTSTSIVQKVIKITDGNNFTNINLQNNNQNIDLINNSFNTVYNIFKVGDKLFFHSFFPQLNYDGSELYLVDNYNQLLNIKEQNILNGENLDFLTIYPNPSSDYVNIKSDKKFTLQNVSAIDMSGKQFVLKSINNKNQFYIRDLNSGVYIIKITTDIGTFHKKFIKK